MKARTRRERLLLRERRRYTGRGMWPSDLQHFHALDPQWVSRLAVYGAYGWLVLPRIYHDREEDRS